MADDRLDDAIDAVVRAVDRIERATRGQRTPPPESPTVESELDLADDAAGDEIEAPIAAADVQPPATTVSPGRAAWIPAAEVRASERRERSKKKHKKKHKARAAEAEHAELSEPLLADEGDDDNVFPVDAELPPAPSAHASAEVLELVGRIVARTQELDDHLEAARALRGEINELVARLATASTHQR